MGAYKTDNSLQVFAAAAYDKTFTASSATAGALFVVDETGAAFGGAIPTDGTKMFKVGQKDDEGSVRFSPLIDPTKMTVKEKTYVAPEEHAVVFGYNGSAGSIDAENAQRYTLRVNFIDNADMYSKQSDLHFFEYVSDSNATQIEIADYFAQIMSKHEKFSGRNAGKNRASVKVERLCSAAGSAGTHGAITVTNGSKHISAATNIDPNSEAVGDYLLLDGVLYKIAEIDTANDTAVLDQPWQGASGTVLEANSKTVPAATAAGANIGIKITGLDQYWSLGLMPFRKINFEVTLDGWVDTTPVANVTAGTPHNGSGHGKEIAELEWFGLGSAGAPYRHGVVNNSNLITSYAVATDTYGVVVIDYDIAAPKYAVAGAGAGRGQLLIALKMATSNHADLETALGISAIF
tara:strand:+ start:502 stop:1719 length:1218 start_codon:yes stop_codon:yes gene_type:complete